MGFFARPADWPAVYDAYRRAIRHEVAQIVASIPNDDLVIQWDIASEVRDILAGDAPLLPWSPETSLEEKWQRHLGDMGHLVRRHPGRRRPWLPLLLRHLGRLAEVRGARHGGLLSVSPTKRSPGPDVGSTTCICR